MISMNFGCVPGYLVRLMFLVSTQQSMRDDDLRIQKEENAGALFVLPSQLNGAEYPSHDSDPGHALEIMTHE